MKVVVDQDIPFLEGVLEPFAQVVYLPGAQITRSAVLDADALLIRTRTKCCADLLEGSSVKFIASATIGTDHVDMEYLRSHGIAFDNAPGCNAGGVMQYVHTCLFAVAGHRGIDLCGKKLGVVGVGNTGGRVAALAERLGFKVLRNDPPRASKEGRVELEHFQSAADNARMSSLREQPNGPSASSAPSFYTLDCLLRESDIITCHVPLDATTRGMASAEFFSAMKPGAFFINASRGEVVVDTALLAARRNLSGLVLDVWNGEPSAISRELLTVTDIATPHIAGYSFEGKVNGTAAVVQALARYFGINELLRFEPPHSTTPVLRIPAKLSLQEQHAFSQSLLSLFPVYDLDSALRAEPDAFERLRAGYRLRREFVWETR